MHIFLPEQKFAALNTSFLSLNLSWVSNCSLQVQNGIDKFLYVQVEWDIGAVEDSLQMFLASIGHAMLFMRCLRTVRVGVWDPDTEGARYLSHVRVHRTSPPTCGHMATWWPCLKLTCTLKDTESDV